MCYLRLHSCVQEYQVDKKHMHGTIDFIRLEALPPAGMLRQLKLMATIHLISHDDTDKSRESSPKSGNRKKYILGFGLTKHILLPPSHVKEHFEN